MSRFLLIVIALYAIPHAALFARLAPVLAPAWRIPVLLGLLVMMATFFIGFSLRHHESPFTRPVVGLSFVWMAFIFWTFSIGLVFDAWNLLGRLVPVSIRPPALPIPLQLRLMTGLLILAFTWSAWEARQIRVRTLTLPGVAAPREIRVAVLSDLHLTPFGNHGAIGRALALLRELKPDILLSAGDLIDAPASQVAAELKELAAIQPPLGKYAILGNHEYYSGWGASVDGHREAGFTMLRESRVEPAPGLVLAGVDDIQGRAFGQFCLCDEDKALPESKDGRIVILLKHRPLVSPEARERATLQISGHTHGGQLFPFHALVRIHFPRFHGLHQDGNLWLYITRGTGTWGPRLRLFAPPEITLLTIPAESK